MTSKSRLAYSSASETPTGTGIVGSTAEVARMTRDTCIKLDQAKCRVRETAEERMAKKLNYSLTYPMPIEKAWETITNPAFQEGKLIDASGSDIKVTVSANDDGTTTIVLDRKNPVTGVPNAVKKIIGEQAHVIETMVWSAAGADGSRTATHQTEFVGNPLAMSGTLALSPNGAQTVLALDAEFRASVPLVGGKLEGTALTETKAAMDSEAAFSARFA